MTERPILFSGPMVVAILEGRKTQTRRVIDPQPDCAESSVGCIGRSLPSVLAMRGGFFFIRCRYGKPGDHLWVRETWHPQKSHKGPVSYRATWKDENPDEGWKPSIFMPRWASRITLEIVSVRVQRLHDITESDARAEGVEGLCHPTFSLRESYIVLWDMINKQKHPWKSNPFVWKIEFRRI